MAGDGRRWWHSACTHHGYTMACLLSMALYLLWLYGLWPCSPWLYLLWLYLLWQVREMVAQCLRKELVGPGRRPTVPTLYLHYTELNRAKPTLYRHYTDTYRSNLWVMPTLYRHYTDACLNGIVYTSTDTILTRA